MKRPGFDILASGLLVLLAAEIWLTHTSIRSSFRLYWILVPGAFAFFPCLWIARWLRKRQRIAHGACLICGYDLRARLNVAPNAEACRHGRMRAVELFPRVRLFGECGGTRPGDREWRHASMPSIPPVPALIRC